MNHSISSQWLSLDALSAIIRHHQPLALSPISAEAIKDCRDYLDEKLRNNQAAIYGINTGFGSLCNTRIGTESLNQLQRNLVMSHACGTGDTVPEPIIRLMLLLKIQSLAHGYSAVDMGTVERLIWHYNSGVLPVIYQQGSLGASGDLAPLAHLSLPLIGLGQVWVDGEITDTAGVLKQHGLSPLTLQSKEGLALLNGTQFMGAYGAYLSIAADRLFKLADLIAAVSLEAFDGLSDPFREEVHRVRPHAGQLIVSKRINRILADSQRFYDTKLQVQDPYSFRCIPQVHGASIDALKHIASIFETEVNAVTDNPTVFAQGDSIISAGNFHGQPLAMALDYLCIALAEMGSISERRVYKLISGGRNLPAFLVANAGLNSGFMIAQYTAAAIVSQNKQLCTPASVDTIDSSNGQEDHVSMGANAATKAWKVFQNTENLLAIELLNAMQGLELRGIDGVASPIVALHAAFREKVAFVEEDTELHLLMRAALTFVQNIKIENYLADE